jgi:hypothetical protein
MYASPLKDLALFFKHGSKLEVGVIKPEHSLTVNAINEKTIRIMNILFKISPKYICKNRDICLILSISSCPLEIYEAIQNLINFIKPKRR